MGNNEVKNRTIFLLSLLLFSGCNRATGITPDGAWALPAGQGENGAIYFQLQNHSTNADELTGISSTVAEAVEMHESKMDGDVMRMRRVTSIRIEAKGSVEFAPGGYHVMLVSLRQELNVGDEFPVTLHFANHEDITLKVPVQEQAPDGMGTH